MLSHGGVFLPWALALGGAVGFIAGLFGVGGGFLLTPLLTILLGVPLEIAIGTGLCQVVATSIVTARRHGLEGGELRFDLLALPGSVIGVEAGARALSALARIGHVTVGGRELPVITLAVEGAYVLLLLLVATLFFRDSAGERTAFVRRGPLTRLAFPPRIDLPSVPMRGVSAIVVAEVGLALGFLSGLLGIGGGVAMMPVLVYGFGFPLRRAAGTGLVVLIVTAAVGTFAHARAGHVSLPLAMALLCVSPITAQLGARLTQRLPPRTLRRAFAAVVATTAGTVVWHLSRLIA